MEQAVNQTEQSAWRQGIAATKAVAAPAIVLNIIAVAIVVGYYHHDATRQALDHIQEVKKAYGLPFAVLTTIIFGAWLPIFVREIQAFFQGKPRGLGDIVFFTVFWGEKGVEVDLLYRAQSFVFGDGHDLPLAGKIGLVSLKVFLDQFVYVPIWGIVSTVFALKWKDCGYNWRATWDALGPDWYRKKVLPVMVMCWFVWVPAVAVIYCLPLPLQLPMQNLVLCLWMLLLMFVTKDGK
jgi:hypothetical protein